MAGAVLEKLQGPMKNGETQTVLQGAERSKRAEPNVQGKTKSTDEFKLEGDWLSAAPKT